MVGVILDQVHRPNFIENFRQLTRVVKIWNGMLWHPGFGARLGECSMTFAHFYDCQYGSAFGFSRFLVGQGLLIRLDSGV